jgi:aspartate racemase
MHIGLIGGIGPAATDFYYRRLIATFASRKAPLELTMAHADTPTLLNNLASNNTAGQAAIFTRLTKRLAVAGANCVVITSIAGHFCMDAFRTTSPLPAVDMIVEVNRAMAERGLSRSAYSEPNGHGKPLLWRYDFGGSHPAGRTSPA